MVMTTNIYPIELKEFIHTHPHLRLNQLRANYKSQYLQLMQYTDFLPQSASLKNRIYCVLHDLFDIPMCKKCGQVKVKWYRQKNQYCQYCSSKCSANDIDVRNKYKHTCSDKYGTDNVFASEAHKKIIKNTNLIKYGCENPQQSNYVREKTKQTNNIKYGADTPLQNAIIKEKIKATNIKRRGVEYPSQCSDVKEKTKQTNLDRYGEEYAFQSDVVKEKTKQTNLDRYDVEYASQSDVVKEKTKQTNLDRYGVEYASQSDVVKEKIKQTNLDRYSVNNPFQFDEFKEKAKCTNLVKRGVEYASQSDDFKKTVKHTCLDRYAVENYNQRHLSSFVLQQLNNSEYLEDQHLNKKLTLSQIGINLNVSDSTVGKYLRKHNITVQHYSFSMAETELLEFIQSFDIECFSGVRTIISPYELDIYIPEYNIAIEYNGLYWHSEAAGKPDNYHLNKTELCEEKGIRLIHIFEDEWRDQQQKCKDTIRHLLGKSPKGVFARNTTIKEIPWKQAKDFLNEYHLLNAGTAGNYRIGAFDNHDNLIGVMVFGQSNNEGGDTAIELKRFVTNKKNNPGLGSKMFKYAITQKQYTCVIAFVDRRWFTGLVKGYIGFTLISYTKPALWWTNGQTRFHRRFKTKQQLIVDGFDPLLSKREALLQLGYYRIWDSGKLKLKWSSA